MPASHCKRKRLFTGTNKQINLKTSIFYLNVFDSGGFRVSETHLYKHSTEFWRGSRKTEQINSVSVSSPKPGVYLVIYTLSKQSPLLTKFQCFLELYHALFMVLSFLPFPCPIKYSWFLQGRATFSVGSWRTFVTVLMNKFRNIWNWGTQQLGHRSFFMFSYVFHHHTNHHIGSKCRKYPFGQHR